MLRERKISGVDGVEEDDGESWARRDKGKKSTDILLAFGDKIQRLNERGKRVGEISSQLVLGK